MVSDQEELVVLENQLLTLGASCKKPVGKDESLHLALKSAELYLGSARRVTNKDVKKNLSSKCNALLDIAEEIKNGSPDESRVQSAIDDALKLAVYRPEVASAETQRVQSGWQARVPSRDIGYKGRIYSGHAGRKTSLETTQEHNVLENSSFVHGSAFPVWESGKDLPNFDEQDELFVDSEELSLSPEQTKLLQGWERPQEALSFPPVPQEHQRRLVNMVTPTMTNEKPVDLVQDAATNCSVVASLLAMVSLMERGFSSLLPSIMYPQHHETGLPTLSRSGKYLFRLNFNGCYRRVVIDDRLPVSNSSRSLRVVDQNNPTLLWPALLEKAYLKVRGGYDLPGSNSGTDVWIIFGWIPEHILTQNEDKRHEDIWAKMFYPFVNGNLMITTGTATLSYDTESATGLVSNHNYAIVALKEEAGRYFCRLKNPWLEDCASTARDNSNNFERDEIRYQHRESWMDFADVMENFESVYLHWNPLLFQHKQDVHFSWEVEASSSSMCFHLNPQYSIISEQGGVLTLVLSKHFPPEKLNLEEYSSRGFTSLYAFESEGQRLCHQRNYVKKCPYVDSPQTTLQLSLSPNQRYTIVLSEQDLVPRLYNFTLSLFSAEEVALQKAWSPYTKVTRQTSSWTRKSAGGDLNSGNYFTNPQFLLQTSSTSPISVVLETTAKDVKIQFRLLRSQDQRLSTLTAGDIIMTSGGYRSSHAHGEHKNLPAGSYNIICSTWESSQFVDFSLRVESATDQVLKLLPNEDAGKLVQRLPDVSFQPESDTMAAFIAPHRLCRCYFVVSSASTTRSLSVQAPKRISLELGRGASHKILTSSNDGKFADMANSIRTEEIDLNPKLVGRDGLWLVLERLGTSIEYGGADTVSVELKTDCAHPLRIGKWTEWQR